MIHQQVARMEAAATHLARAERLWAASALHPTSLGRSGMRLAALELQAKAERHLSVLRELLDGEPERESALEEIHRLTEHLHSVE